MLARERSDLSEPVADIDQHRRHHRRFDDAEDKANGRQRRDIMHNTGQRGAAAPEDQADKDQFANAAALRIDSAGDLEEEVAEEEQGPSRE